MSLSLRYWFNYIFKAVIWRESSCIVGENAESPLVLLSTTGTYDAAGLPMDI